MRTLGNLVLTSQTASLETKPKWPQPTRSSLLHAHVLYTPNLLESPKFIGHHNLILFTTLGNYKTSCCVQWCVLMLPGLPFCSFLVHNTGSLTMRLHAARSIWTLTGLLCHWFNSRGYSRSHDPRGFRGPPTTKRGKKKKQYFDLALWGLLVVLIVIHMSGLASCKNLTMEFHKSWKKWHGHRTATKKCGHEPPMSGRFNL